MGAVKGQITHLAEYLLKIDRVRSENRAKLFQAYQHDASRLLQVKWSQAKALCVSCQEPTVAIKYQNHLICKFCGEEI